MDNTKSYCHINEDANTDLSKMLDELTEEEKQTLVDGIDFALDYDLADTIPQSDMDLYNAIIKERSEEKPSIRKQLTENKAKTEPTKPKTQKKEDISL